MPKILKIKVTPNSKTTKLVEESSDTLKIKLQAPALEGKANKALIAFLSGHFHKPKSKIILLHGEKSKQKTVKIED